MGDLKDFFDSFYQKFILRDFLAKIIPGFILFSSLWWSLDSDFERLKNQIPINISFWEWVFIIGISWMLGLAIQSVGEKFCITPYPRIFGKLTFEEIKSLYEEFTKPENNELKEIIRGKNKGNFNCLRFFYNSVKFHNEEIKIFKKEPESQYFERIVVLKEACGNVCMSLILSTIFIVLINLSLILFNEQYSFDCRRTFQYMPVFVFIIVIISFLYRMHREHRIKQFYFTLIKINDNSKTPKSNT